MSQLAIIVIAAWLVFGLALSVASSVVRVLEKAAARQEGRTLTAAAYRTADGMNRAS